MVKELLPKILKMATLRPSENWPFERDTFILNYDRTPMDVFHARIIRAVAKGLGVTFNIVIPEDNIFGYRNSDGNWTGLKRMLIRGETDLAVSGFTLSSENIKIFNFTYPLHMSDVTFMTNKLEPHPKSFAIFDVFSPGVWIGIGLCLTVISLLLYFILRKREKYSTVLLGCIGCLLEESFSFAVKQRNTTLLLLHWFICIIILTTSYKAVILSIITVPRMVGIRDISDLSIAAKQNSVMCMTFKGAIANTQWFEDESFKIIGECLSNSFRKKLYELPAFINYPHKKAFLANRFEINIYNRYFFVSDDSLSMSYIGMPYSRNFCCPRTLEKVIHRMVAAGLVEKHLKDQEFIAQLILPKTLGVADDGINISPLKVSDFSGAFYVLFVGYFCSLIVFIAEIAYKKLSF